MQVVLQVSDPYAKRVILLSLVLATLAVARVTRFLTEDRLTLGYRRWMVGKWGEDSLPAYLAHCPWCTSLWVAAPVMVVTVLTFTTHLPLWQRLVLILLSWPAASMASAWVLARWED